MKQIRNALSQYLHHPNRKNLLNLDHIKNHWLELTGELSRHIHPVSLDNGQLICHVSHPALLQEFSFIEAHLLERLKVECPDAGVQRIKCLLGENTTSEPILSMPDKWSGRKQHYEIDNTEIEQELQCDADPHIERSVNEIEDVFLRQRVQRLFYALKNRQKIFQDRHWGICKTCQSFVEPGREYCLVCLKPVK